MSGSLSPPNSGTGVYGMSGVRSNGSGVHGVRFKPGKYLSSNSAHSEIRECDGFSDPRGLRSRVGTGTGTGWHITTLIKPVSMVRV